MIRSRIIPALLVVMGLVRVAAALGPDNLLLLVNSNVPESRALAEQYGQLRKLPPGRILELQLPAGEQIPFDTFERQVLPPVRAFLRQHKLEGQVQCLVSFYGLPLRVAARQLNAQDKQQLTALQAAQRDLQTQVEQVIAPLEQELSALDAAFQPANGNDLEAVLRRAEVVFARLPLRMQGDMDAAKRQKIKTAMTGALLKLRGPFALLQAQPNDAAARQEHQQLLARLQAVQQQIQQLSEQRYDLDARQRLLKVAAESLGLVDQLHLTQAQVDYLADGNTVAAFDNELALLWWPMYPRANWQVNALHYRARRALRAPPVLMTARLDAPTAARVRQMMQTSLEVEKTGLRGKAAIDSRGIDGSDRKQAGFAAYDQTLRNLAELVSGRTKLEVVHDQRPEVLAARSVEQAAWYCGWYSVRNYVPGCTFSPGAVGFHIASFELVSLHSPNERGWVAGLLNDGAVASIGPVAEPYLHAFPAADDFFPLLLTGKLTLAEVYWRTSPLTSWMMVLIGDPLYTPYKANPPLPVEQLPERLRGAIPATAPAGAPLAPGAGPQ
jgi:uncharacterized protein (TIGR03790 family)